MAVSDCIDAGVADGSISRETADRARKTFDDLDADFEARTSLTPHEREVRVAQRLEADLERARVRRKRMRLLQISKQQDIMARLAKADAGQVEKAALAVLEFDPSGKYMGANVADTYLEARGTAMGIMEDFLFQFRSKAAGLSRDTTMLPDVARALFGEDAPPMAKGMADAYHKARLYLIRRYNAAGADIRLLENFGTTQRHDGDLIRQVSKQEWKTYIRDRLDPSKMRDAAGEPVTLRQLDRMIDEAYDDITGAAPLSTEAAQFGSPISKYVHHREFVFKDSTAFLEYHERFGGGDILSAMIGGIDRMARDLALIETMGPYPQATMRAMEAAIERDRSAAGDKSTSYSFLRAVFDDVSGRSALATDSKVANTLQGMRNLLTASRLGSAIFVSASDFGTMRVTAKMNGIPASKVIGEYARELNPANPAHRRKAARLGYAASNFMGDLIGVQRMMGEVSGPAVTAKVADTVLRASGLTAHTDSLRNAYRTVAVGELTENARFAFHSIDPELKAALERYGVTAQEWDLYRSTPIWTDRDTGADLIRIGDVVREFEDVRIAPDERTARAVVAQKLHSWVNTEARFAVPEPTARARAWMHMNTERGTAIGEISRSFFQFKSFMVTFNYLHGARGLAMEGAFNKAKYAAALFVPLTLAGAFAEQMSSIARGRDPYDMTDPRFWVSAVARGGSLGPLGDFMFAQGGVVGGKDRFGHSFMASLAGPLAGQVDALQQLGQAAFSGENVAPELRRFAEGFLPGNSLWYGRLALERLIKDQIEELADPSARQKFQRAERRARKEFGQEIWWRRGELSPDRLPNVAGAVGQ